MAEKITLKKLELTNYRNIDHAIYEFNGNSKIVGENRIGKTNTLEAINFLLTNSLLNGANDLASIKPSKDTKLVVKVEGVFQVGEKQITLAKEYGEEWVKQRNTDQVIFKGHFENYFYNGVKQGTVRDYATLIATDFGVNQDSRVKVDYLKMLTNPFYLGDMGEGKDWTNLREFIINLVGDVSDDDVYKAEPLTLAIKEDMERQNGRIDQLKKLYTSDRDALNDAILGNDAQIDMLEKTNKPTDEEIAVAKKGIEDIDNDIALLKSGKGVDNASIMLREKIVNIQNDIYKLQERELEEFAKSNGSTDNRAKTNELNSKILEITTNISNINGKISTNEFRISNLERAILNCDHTRNELLCRVKVIDSKLSDPSGEVETSCPTCGQAYPTEKLNEILSNYSKQLNDEKNDIIAKGKKNNEDKITFTNELNELKNENEMLGNDKAKLEVELLTIKEELEKLNSSTTERKTYVPSDELNKLNEEKHKLETELKDSQENFATAQSSVNSTIYEKEQSKAAFQKVIDDLAYYNRQTENLTKVREERRSNSKKLMDIEQKKDLLNKFIFTKLKLLDINVGKIFGNIKFQLIQENINGGFDPICKPYIYNIDKDESTKVSWRSGSKSEKVITGIAILEKIRTKLHLPDMPMLFDEGGEISTDTFATKFKTNSQIICVKVQDNVPTPMVLAI